MRFGIIGSGISGIAAAKVLQQLGHAVTLFEREQTVGGVWAQTYPHVKLQNIGVHYQFSDLDWPQGTPDHPSAEQVLAYLKLAVEHYDLDVRLGHEVKGMKARKDGWDLTVQVREKVGDKEENFAFDRIIIAAGMFTGAQGEIALPGQEEFEGQILTQRDIDAFEEFRGKQIGIIGFGKTAVDLATMAAERGAQIQHIFRKPRWLLPRLLFGMKFAKFAASRFTSLWTPSWEHPRKFEALMHKYSAISIWCYWFVTQNLMRLVHGLHPFYWDKSVRARMALLCPDQPLTYQMRAASALAPDNFYALARTGDIEPVLGEVSSLTKRGLVLTDGREIRVDALVAAVGYKAPDFAYLPKPMRKLMRQNEDGTQLYRHTIHPQILNLAFAGFNHAYLHTVSVEVATLWYHATQTGGLNLPSEEEMLANMARVAKWKRDHTLFEPARAYGVGGRFHKYLDVLLREIGLNPARKSSIWDENIAAYLATDYASIIKEYQALNVKGRESLPLDG